MEKIGVVIAMLMAHSEALQSEMVLKDIEDKKCITVDDMYPDTFRNLLRYVYGYDSIASLSFDDADNLLYAAEKYMIGTLKARLADRLIKLLNPSNICSLLNNPVCYKHLELDSAITKILQSETGRVLGSPQFIGLSSDALIKVFEQDAMNVLEIEVWRAAIKWAKYRTNSDNGQDLRKALEGPSKHIRVCTIDDGSLFDEVYPTGVLTDKEINLVSFSKFKNVKQSDLVEFCNEIECRSNRVRNIKISTGYPIPESINAVYICTKTKSIELLPFHFESSNWRNDSFVPDGFKQVYKCNISITRITDYKEDTSSEPPLTVDEFCKEVECGKQFSVPITKDGKNIILLPKNKYFIHIDFNDELCMFYPVDSARYIKEHIYLSFTSLPGRMLTPFKTLYYQPLFKNKPT